MNEGMEKRTDGAHISLRKTPPITASKRLWRSARKALQNQKEKKNAFQLTFFYFFSFHAMTSFLFISRLYLCIFFFRDYKRWMRHLEDQSIFVKDLNFFDQRKMF